MGISRLMDVDDEGMLMQRSIHSIKTHEFVRFTMQRFLFPDKKIIRVSYFSYQLKVLSSKLNLKTSINPVSMNSE